MRLAGAVESREERDELLHQARDRIRHGIDGVDAKDLIVVDRKETPGILNQALIAAFHSREVAELARVFVPERSRVVPRRHEILDRDHTDKAGRLIPNFIPDAMRALEAGQAILVLQVDETEVFNVREVLEEETRRGGPGRLAARIGADTEERAAVLPGDRARVPGGDGASDHRDRPYQGAVLLTGARRDHRAGADRPHAVAHIEPQVDGRLRNGVPIRMIGWSAASVMILADIAMVFQIAAHGLPT
jgi:hypothetical protein